MYYSAFGTIIGLVVGIAVSWLTNNPEHLRELNPELITPWMRRFLPEKGSLQVKTFSDKKYRSVAREEEIQMKNGYK